MKKTLAKQIVKGSVGVGCACLVAGLLCGCATQRVKVAGGAEPVLVPALAIPPGTLAVITTSSVPCFSFNYPRGDVTGPGQMAEKGLYLGGDRASTSHALAATYPMSVVALPFMFVGGIVGSLAGEVTGAHERSLDEASAALNRFLSSTNFQEGLRGIVTKELRRNGSLLVASIAKPLPPGFETGWDRVPEYAAGTLAWVPKGESAREYLLGQKIDTVLEIRVQEHGLRGKPGQNENQSFFAELEVRVVRVKDGAELGRRQISYASQPKKFTKWMAKEAALLRQQFSDCLQVVSQQITSDLGAGSAGETELRIAQK